jgi:acetoin utilization deacetylase AcuC-like enzyme
MATALYGHDDFRGHVTPPGHPEQVARAAAALRGLQGMALDRRAAPLADDLELLRCHPADYVERLRDAVPASGWAQVDGDTFLSPGSWNAAVRAVGGACAAVDAVIAGDVANAFVASRPPGHHAETATAMGFCLFGTVAIAAKRALDHHGLSRVVVLDFDVHHGNGTQDLLWNEARAMFCSSHQMPLYPGTGRTSEVGAHGQIVNMPLASGSGTVAMRRAWDDMAFPRLEAFEPELIIVSAGFDAHADDPLAGLMWREDDFAWITHRICDLADAHAGGRVVSVLEGGYDLDALAASVAAHVGVLMERGRQ